MESSDATKEIIRSSSSERTRNMKSKSSAALIKNTNHGLVIRDTGKHEAEDAKRKKSNEIIVLHEKKSHIKSDNNKDSKDVTPEIKEDRKKSVSKNDSNEDSKGVAKLHLIIIDKRRKKSESTTSHTQEKNKDIKDVKSVTGAAKNKVATHTNQIITRSRLRKLLETEHGKNAFDYLSIGINTKLITNVHGLRKSIQRKRPGVPPKPTQAKKMKK